jgi:ectoine hydroxylase-related dioxygenase (phytanoyl-CoA dioxygenase family)
MPDWSQLESHGFLWIPGFLSPPEVEAFAADYRAGRQTVVVDYGRFQQTLERPNSLAVIQPILARIEAMCRQIAEHTSVRADTLVKAFYFASDVLTYPWHQDIDFWAEDRTNLLNFYLPILKPDRAKTNLSLIPHLALPPELRPRFVGRGAQSFHQKDGQTYVYDVGEGTMTPLDLDLDAIATTPELVPGDLLLLRGDVIHRSQDADTKRVAISIRMARSQSLIHKDRLISGPPAKQAVLAGLADEYGPILRAFEALQKEALTLGEVQDWIRRAPSRSAR